MTWCKQNSSAKHHSSPKQKYLSSWFLNISISMILATWLLTLMCVGVSAGQLIDEPPEGYYAFIESPNAQPPRVKRPPYIHSDKECAGAGHSSSSNPHLKSLNNLCGDLNKGYIPRNPMNQNVLGKTYPFELIKNKTLEFFSRTLPILKIDETLPRVAKYQQEQDAEDWSGSHLSHNSLGTSNSYGNRMKRDSGTQEEKEITGKTDETEMKKENPSTTETKNSTVAGRGYTTREAREGRKFCETGGGVFCMLYRAFNGESLVASAAERRDELQLHGEAPAEYRRGEGPSVGSPAPHHHDPSLPPTPCPAKVDYATPVFAKNYQGVWRYVVQIPYEGYFTQTVEVTRCMQSRCHYLDGGCLSSPRWTSLLVAEIYYPDTFLPPAPSGDRWPNQRNPVTGENPPPVHDFQNYQQYLRKRAGVQAPAVSSESATTRPVSKNTSHCDGVDDIGCFQVRLYYDWFLIPGSCKCWRPDYFSRYVRRKVSTPDL